MVLLIVRQPNQFLYIGSGALLLGAFLVYVQFFPSRRNPMASSMPPKISGADEPGLPIAPTVTATPIKTPVPVPSSSSAKSPLPPLGISSLKATTLTPSGLEFWTAPFRQEPHLDLYMPQDAEGVNDPNEVLLDAAEKEIREEKATEALAILTKIQQPSERALADIAIAYFLKQDFQRAADTFTDLTRRNPLASHYFLGRGEMQFLQGKYLDAIVSFEIGQAVDQSNPLLSTWLGLANARLGRWAVCVDAFRVAAGLDEKNLQIRIWLAHASVLNGDEESARSILSETLKHAPDKPNLHVGLALLALQRNDPKAALEALQRGRVPIAITKSAEDIVRSPVFSSLHEDPGYQNWLMNLHTPNGPPSGTVLAAPPATAQPSGGQPALAVDPAAAILIEKGNDAAKKGDLDVAVKFYEAALQMDTDNVRLLNNLGVCYVSQREFGKAVALLERARNLDPTYAKGYYNLGLAYQGLGWRKMATETWRRGLAVDPNHDTMRKALDAEEKK